MNDLLPDDPEAIRRIYRGLKTREALERVAFRRFDDRYLALARLVDLVLILGVPLIVPELYGGLAGYVRTLAGYAALALGTYGLYLLVGRAVLRHRYGRFHPYVERPERFWALGPVSLAFLLLALPKRIAPEEIDPTSLDVLEPVAREIAAPLLTRAREPGDGLEAEGARRLAEVEVRIAELRREREQEADDTWRARIDQRARVLDERASAIREDLARILAVRTELTQVADAVEAGLDRLARHRRLLAEMREEPAEERRDALDGLRDRLAALHRSVEEIERASGARNLAEDELREYLRE